MSQKPSAAVHFNKHVTLIVSSRPDLDENSSSITNTSVIRRALHVCFGKRQGRYRGVWGVKPLTESRHACVWRLGAFVYRYCNLPPRAWSDQGRSDAHGSPRKCPTLAACCQQKTSNKGPLAQNVPAWKSVSHLLPSFRDNRLNGLFVSLPGVNAWFPVLHAPQAAHRIKVSKHGICYGQLTVHSGTVLDVPLYLPE